MNDARFFDITYLNGEFIKTEDAVVPVSDRGFMFGDGVYEVIPVFNGTPFRLKQHIDRLFESLNAIALYSPLSPSEWEAVLHELSVKNNGGNQALYVQLTRGPALTRKHLPPPNPKPTYLAMSVPTSNASLEDLRQGCRVITLTDCRWSHCSIKAITLLPNVLMGQQASEQGCDDAILIHDGYVTEATASNVFIIESDNIITTPKSPLLLGGITRDLVIELAQKHDLTLKEEAIDEARLTHADEIWLTSSSREIRPVIELNQQAVGAGKAGPMWEIMMTHYQTYKESLLQYEKNA